MDALPKVCVLGGVVFIASYCYYVYRGYRFWQRKNQSLNVRPLPEDAAMDTMLRSVHDEAPVDEAFMDQWRDLEQRSGVVLSLAEARQALLLEMVYGVTLSRELPALQRLRQRYHPRALHAAEVLFPPLPSFDASIPTPQSEEQEADS